ncbi:MAG: hypothetical protein WBV89_06330 [Ilumatobacter sp.]
MISVTADPGTSSSRTSVRLVVAMLLAGVIGLAAAGCGGSEDSGPEQPTYSYVIPAGAGDRIDEGEPLDILPRELVAQLNETVIIVNEDDQAHLLGPWFVGPGETLRQRFTTPGVFEDSCTVHPSGKFTVVVET